MARALNGMGRHQQAQDVIGRMGPDTQLPPPLIQVERHGVLSQIALSEGDLCQAEALADYALARAEEHGNEHLPGALDARITIAALHRERNELEAAVLELSSFLDAPHGTASAVTDATAALQLAQAQFVATRAGAAFEILSEFRHGVRSRHLPIDMVWRFDALEARLRLHLGDVDGARPLVPRVVDRVAAELLLARIDMLEGSPEKACARMEAVDRGDLTLRSTIELLIVRSIATLAVDRVEAQHIFESAIQLARPHRFVRLFLDEGRDIAPLLERNGIVAASVRAAPPSHALTAGAARAPLERLSERERVIVRYLNGSMPQADSASDLVISDNTLKTHLKSIYRKLGVNSRHQAVVRAREMGLV
jgi:LuxR family maltose regulon positive regulatory protein